MTHITPKAHYAAQITDRPTSLILVSALLATLVITGTAGCQHASEAGGPSDEPRSHPVRVAEVQPGPESSVIRLPGVTRSVARADLAFLHGGHLAERRVRRGQVVSAGEVLAVLHNPALMPGVSSAEARVREIDRQLEQLGRETRRLENLHERGLVATDDLDRTRSRRDALIESRQAAEAALAEAREQLEEGSLRAPFAGEVVELLVEPGQYLAPGQPVLSLAAPERLEVAANVPARQARQLKHGQPVTLRQIENTEQLIGELTEIGPAAPGRPARLIVSLPEQPGPAWGTGQAVHLELGLAENASMTVPMAALIRPAAGSARVFRVNGHSTELIEVEPGLLREGRVSVNGALTAGDRVVIAGHGRLLDGDRVRVIE
jgi:RND family efflux transporter MFP subunit